MGDTWNKAGWRSKPRIQMPDYGDAEQSLLVGPTGNNSGKSWVFIPGASRRQIYQGIIVATPRGNYFAGGMGCVLFHMGPSLLLQPNQR